MTFFEIIATILVMSPCNISMMEEPLPLFLKLQLLNSNNDNAAPAKIIPQTYFQS